MLIRHLLKWEVAFDFALAILRFYFGGRRRIDNAAPHA
jgi:hypothetical protein